MDWLISKLLATAFWTVLGFMLGAWAGHVVGGAWVFAALGAALGAVLSVAQDRWRGVRLLDWLRRSDHGPAPRDAGFWGELAYRVEKWVRQQEKLTLAEQERIRQFIDAIDASPNGVMSLNELQEIEWCNKGAADHFGLDPVRDMHQRVTHLVRAPAFVTHLQEGQFDQPIQFESPRSKCMLSVIVRPFGDGRLLVLSQDVTERERMEAMRRDFVANVSHEIRTPLTVLAGFIETLVDVPLNDAERARVLALMQTQSDRMQALVSDLLTLAQLEGSPRPTADQWVAVPALLGQVRSVAVALSKGQHTLEVGSAEGAELAGAATEMQSALTNLVTNAVRYTPPGGAIHVSWRLGDDGTGVLEVTDTGPGIAKEHLPRLTERFYRVDGGRSRETGGTGLGLSIVKHIVQRHGGQIDVQSEVGKGSTFRLVFPAFRVRVALPAAQEASAGMAEGASKDSDLAAEKAA